MIASEIIIFQSNLGHCLLFNNCYLVSFSSLCAKLGLGMDKTDKEASTHKTDQKRIQTSWRV